MRSSRSARLEALGARPFAHRGLFGDGRVENSRAAVLAAIEAGHGMEVDVQGSRDGAVVFHDYRLERLTGIEGRVADFSTGDLRGIPLRGSDETIPTLTDILALIGGHAPLLIEVKAPHRKVAALCRAVAGALDRYSGSFGIMSFNPAVSHWFARHRPEMLRGLVVTEEWKRGLKGAIQRRLSLWWSRAEFLAYDVRDFPSPFATRARARGMPVYSWTVRSEEGAASAALHADQIIYEHPVRP
ncbi:glycerophosphodiester phosphodiesterase family protein [Allosphingosinicella vermicomposti]|uniref:glycerophosphodiester phosphodiesterase family protein n=1 Tax=Allosphingosinicella vermicomposti TaxID=614671 RepID=UPI000D0FD7DF|nr:glycerophosphodiester phosphodiesterase family protein [Allosphingosinicella vermicomposti]